MFYLAKFMQAFGLADTGYALFVGMTQPHSMGREIQLMLLGLGVFTVGRLMERWSSAQG